MSSMEILSMTQCDVEEKTEAPKPEALPFIKWVGGKRNLLESFAPLLPEALAAGQIHTYCEPFLGGGSMFLSLASRYTFQRIHLMDINPDLVLTYQTVRDHCDALIARLEQAAEDYFGLSPSAQEVRFQQARSAFNQRRQTDRTWDIAERIEHASHFIFLNKTCYGGMFRVNKSGGFNVPFGKHKRPQIVHPANLKRVSALLASASIEEASYDTLPKDLGPGCFVYFDPPYRPLSATASFTTYHDGGFHDADQSKLAALFRELDQSDVHLMLSNSDPMSEDPPDPFFEDLYAGFRFHRVGALRKINSNLRRRGRKAELVITNEPGMREKRPPKGRKRGEMEQLSWLCHLAGFVGK